MRQERTDGRRPDRGSCRTSAQRDALVKRITTHLFVGMPDSEPTLEECPGCRPMANCNYYIRSVKGASSGKGDETQHKKRSDGEEDECHCEEEKRCFIRFSDEGNPGAFPGDPPLYFQMRRLRPPRLRLGATGAGYAAMGGFTFRSSRRLPRSTDRRRRSDP